MARRSRKEHLEFATSRILLIDNCQATRNVRVAILRERGIDVHNAENLEEARFFFQPGVYDLVLLDVRRYLPGEALDFYRYVKDCAPRQRIAFLLGAPRYLSLTLPDEFLVMEDEPRQWDEMVKKLSAAA